MFWAQTLIESVDEEYLSCALKFKTFENTSQKLWPNMLFFFINGHFEKNHSFQKRKNLKLVFFIYICEESFESLHFDQ